MNDDEILSTAKFGSPGQCYFLQVVILTFLWLESIETQLITERCNWCLFSAAEYTDGLMPANAMITAEGGVSILLR